VYITLLLLHYIRMLHADVVLCTLSVARLGVHSEFLSRLVSQTLMMYIILMTFTHHVVMISACCCLVFSVYFSLIR